MSAYPEQRRQSGRVDLVQSDLEDSVEQPRLWSFGGRCPRWTRKALVLLLDGDAATTLAHRIAISITHGLAMAVAHCCSPNVQLQ